MAKELWQAVNDVPGLTAPTAGGKQAELYQRFGNPMGDYVGSYDQNIFLLNKINSGDFGAPAQAAAPTPTTPEEVTPYLNQVQQQEITDQNDPNKLFQDPQLTGAKTTRDEALGKVTVMPNAPTAPNLEQTFNDLRDQYDVGSMETDLNNLKAQEANVRAELRVRTANTKNSRVGLGVIAGQTDELTTQANNDLDFINRQIQTKTEQVSTAYNLISTIANFKQTDWSNAMTTYNAELTKNLKFYEIANDNYKDIRDFTERTVQRNQDNARANLQIYVNLAAEGAINTGNLDQGTKLMLAKLEVQSGLPIGFVSQIQVPENKRVMNISTRVDSNGNKVADILMMGKNGQGMEVVHRDLGVDQEYLDQKQAQQVSQSIAYMNAQAAVDAAANKGLAAQKDAAQQMTKAFNSDVDESKKALRNDSNWAEVYNTMKARYPGVSNQDLDAALGVPKDWIASGKPGYEWWDQYGK